ncbi:unnamed protein product [Brachionus calyciflorus]|uniref:Uncharacterized protein n=1 Tax=Brachionus calyciflorus TaxID=104777 RepID=A0A813VMN5_9BILA|nr:unnamed protein product [Brachionus calyciflorus]
MMLKNIDAKKKIKDILREINRTEENLFEYKEFINLLGSLSLLLPNKVVEGFKIIKEFIPNDSKCIELYKYFENQWFNNFLAALTHLVDTTQDLTEPVPSLVESIPEVAYTNLETIELPVLVWSESDPLTAPTRLINVILRKDDDEEPNFNYVRSLMNHNPFKAMSDAKRAESARKNEEYMSAIKDEELNEEVRRNWRSISTYSNRKRITKSEIDLARLNLKRRILERVNVQLSAEFLERYS